MKKILLAVATLMLGTAVNAQTFVSTEPANKNVVLEEFTGVNCGYCPDGHRIAAELMANNPGRVFAINIHTGSYAYLYNTQWGTALMNQSGLTGFPMGTVNRHKFAGESTTAMSRNLWTSASNEIMAEASPVNVAAKCTIDYATRIMTVEVEVYYTGNSSASTNMLNVAVLQDNIIGPQGGSSYNPSQVEGSQYRHMHMLRHLLTGQWGETINQTTEGSFWSNTYTWHLPSHIGNNGDTTAAAQYPVDGMPEDLEVVVFVAEGQQEILTGCAAETVITNGVPAAQTFKTLAQTSCALEIGAETSIINMSDDEITSMEITYTCGNQTYTYNWTGNLAAGATTEITLPTIDNGLQNGTTYTLNCQITKVNGEDFTSNTKSATATPSTANAQGYVHFTIKTDQYGSETTWKFKKLDGTVLRQGGPYTNSVKTYEYFLVVPEDGCYQLDILDSYGDGISNGIIKLQNPDGTVIASNNGSFASSLTFFIDITNHEENVGIESAQADQIALYPNPATSNITLTAGEQIESVKVVNTLGQVVYSNNSVNAAELSINTEEFNAGLYIATVKTANGIITKRFSVVR